VALRHSGEDSARLIGAVGLLVTWLYDLDASLNGAMPRPYPVLLWAAGIMLLTMAGVRFVRRANTKMNNPG